MKKVFTLLALPVISIFSSAGIAGEPVDPNIFINLAKKIVPSVVNISTVSTVKGSSMPGGPDDLFRKFFEDFLRQHGRNGDDEEEDSGGPQQLPPNSQKLPKAVSLGSGFIIDPSGLILTNNHVVAEAEKIKIFFTEALDEKPTDGEVVGRDPELDIALIRVKTSRKLTPVIWGDSDSLEQGEYVLAVGNPFGQGHSVTHGIISAKQRLAPEFPLANYLQTDAPINPGNSGGPLVNLKGEVIGINNAIYREAQGIGFAIPSNFVKTVLPQLKSKGMVTRGYIGVLVHPLSPDLASKIGAAQNLEAPFVTHVYPDGPAEKAGLKPYDVILQFNGKSIRSPNELVSAVTSVPVGESVPIRVSRSGKELNLSIKVAQRPGAQAKNKGESEKKKRGKKSRIDTGMELEDLTSETSKELGLPEKTKGVLVTSTNYGGSADSAGVMRGDIIVEVDRKSIKDVDAFYSIVKEKKSYLLRIRRPDPQGHELFTVVILDLKGS